MIRNNKKVKTNFFNSKIIKCLSNHKEYINNYLKNSFTEYLDSKNISSNLEENFVECEIANNKLNIFGKHPKSFYINNDNEIFIEFLIEFPEGEYSIFGLRILKNGKIFGGRFNEFGLQEGNGIYISRKGDLNVGVFYNNDLKEAIIYCFNGTSYEGTLLNLKKHGQEQTEISGNYEFIGDFENGKKVQGIYFPKNEQEEDNPLKLRSIEIGKESLLSLKKIKKSKKSDDIENFNKEIFNQDSEKFLAKIIFDYEGEILIYMGQIKGNKFNDINAVLMFDLENQFPFLNASIKNNVKDGECTFYNDANNFYKGFYKDGIFYSDIEKNFQEENK